MLDKRAEEARRLAFSRREIPFAEKRNIGQINPSY